MMAMSASYPPSQMTAATVDLLGRALRDAPMPDKPQRVRASRGGQSLPEGPPALYFADLSAMIPNL